MSYLCWLTDKQMRWRKPQSPLSPDTPRLDDKRVLSGIVFLIRNGLRAPRSCSPSRGEAGQWRSERPGAGALQSCRQHHPKFAA